MPAAATILIVDDYPDSLDVWDLYLRASGFEVLRAEDGTEALRTACEHLPDLVVMDLELPGLTGCQVAAALRERAETRHIPLIASRGIRCQPSSRKHAAPASTSCSSSRAILPSSSTPSAAISPPRLPATAPRLSSDLPLWGKPLPRNPPQTLVRSVLKGRARRTVVAGKGREPC